MIIYLYIRHVLVVVVYLMSTLSPLQVEAIFMYLIMIKLYKICITP